jgi:uncharacterized protein YbbC (DUF1343 family)
MLIEKSNLSEERGTTLPLEIFGAPKLNIEKIIKDMRQMAPAWLEGCHLRSAFFEPTFHKFKGELVNAMQVHVDGPWFSIDKFRPSIKTKNARRISSSVLFPLPVMPTIPTRDP